MKNHILKQASSAYIRSWTWLVGNERSNCEPLSPRTTHTNVDLDTGSRVRRLLAGREASFISHCVHNTNWKSGEGDRVCVSSLPPSLLSCLSIKPLPVTSPAPASLDPSLWLVKIDSVEGICHGDAFVSGRQGRGYWSLPLCSVPLGNMGLFSVSWPCFPIPWF